MNGNRIKEITDILRRYQKLVREGYRLWVERESKCPESPEELIAFLCEVFEVEERAIERERNRPFATDDYEKGVRDFAVQLMKELLEDNETLVKIVSYEKLLGHRHMAYAFYHLRNNSWEGQIEITHNEKKKTAYERVLYSGLVTFYDNYYGRFSDNEEAIWLLCKYYPKEDDSWLKRDEVISALLSHIRSAGTPNDFGYAFHGIERIQRYICGLPNDLIQELLKQYTLFEVVNQRIYRHQMFAMIDGSKMEEEEKRLLKFFYLDSLMLANAFNMVWVDKKKANDEEIEIYYNSYDDKLDDSRIYVLKKPDAFWDNDNMEKRLFLTEEEQTASVFKEDDTIVFSVGGKENRFKFVYDDWELEDFSTRETRGLIREMLSGRETFRAEDKHMSFSLLYLDNYRGIQRRILDFDHKYTFDPDSGKLRHNLKKISGLHFYGRAVYSLSCIVGKNGTGKTSIIDFLRNTFYKIFKILETFEIPCENGHITLDDLDKFIHLDKNIRFLVVFRVGKKDYYLTNINKIKAKDLSPYQKGIGWNLDFCKVAYFSQQMSTDQLMQFETKVLDIRNEQSVAKVLEGWRQSDYSEMISFVRKKNELANLQNWKDKLSEKTEQIINREICYLFSLLRNVGVNIICKYLCVLPEKKLVIYNLDTGELLEEFLFQDFEDDISKISKIEKIEDKYARMPNIQIGNFSSGQYAKLKFLAKLHWFLVGYNKDREYYSSLFGETFRFEDEALQMEESALIFIDEGELYYHPEWQRRFLKDILDMFNLCHEEVKLQVVFTTNSPFVISDVLKEDILYLSDKGEDFGNTLGQNIHKLLKNNFFMDYTIGEYSRELIGTLISLLNEKDFGEEKEAVYKYFSKTQDKNEFYSMVELLIQQLGEAVYREKLETMLEQRIASDQTLKEMKIQKLERQKADLEKEIGRLRGEENDKD